jgi:hypothetical protein
MTQQDCAMNPDTIEHAFIRFSGDSGYSRHGDTVSLYADRIHNLYTSGVTSGSLALQLWACQAPYAGGHLTGWKLAELKLGILEAHHFIAPVKADVPGYFPEHGDYAIVLVIAEWDGEDFNLIHDFHNYPSRDVFLHPRLEGLVGYRCIDDGRLAVDVERIHNPRDSDNMSGTLSLELWALSEPYVVGDFAGYALGGVALGTLAGSASWQNCSYDLEISPPPPDLYTLVLMLREWDGNGYVTRDHSNFRDRVTFPLVTETQSFPEGPATDNTDEEVANAAQAPAAVFVAPIAGQERRTAHEPDSTEFETTVQASSAQANETITVSALLVNIKSIAQWLLEKIRQQLAI